MTRRHRRRSEDPREPLLRAYGPYWLGGCLAVSAVAALCVLVAVEYSRLPKRAGDVAAAVATAIAIGAGMYLANCARPPPAGRSRQRRDADLFRNGPPPFEWLRRLPAPPPPPDPRANQPPEVTPATPPGGFGTEVAPAVRMRRRGSRRRLEKES